jgi:hypothetical protein
MDDAVLTPTFFPANTPKDLSYARQSRHAANRVRGPPKDTFGTSHKASDAGDIFGNYDSREKSSPRRGAPGQVVYLEESPENRGRSGGLYGTSSLAYDDRLSNPPDSYQAKASNMGYNSSNNILNMDSRLKTTKDLGMTVTEPSDYGRNSRHDDGTYGIQRDMQNLWSSDGPSRNFEAGAASTTKFSGGQGLDAGEIQRDTEEAVQPFSWDVRHHESSRALVITRASSLPTADVRSICESFGTLDTFRAEFVDRGIFFVSYYNMRAAQCAAMELQSKLQRLDSGGDKVFVQFCVPLNSSLKMDESLVVLMDLPREMGKESLAQMLSAYGAVRSVRELGGTYGGSSFVVEYYDVQDAKQACLELESTEPWGPNASVEVGDRNPADRKRGRELLTMISHWRHGGDSSSDNRLHPPGTNRGVYHSSSHRSRSPDQQRSQFFPGSQSGPRHDIHYERGGHPQETTKVVYGPDGRIHSYVVVNPPPPSYGGPPSYHGEHVVHSNRGTYVTHHVPPPYGWSPHGAPSQHHFSGGGSVVSASSSHHSGHYSGSRSVPTYYPDGASSVGSHSHNIRSVAEGGTSSRGDRGDDKDNRHLKLDFDAVENGRDSRTSLMVRNIPNKYTQQMLLSEFAENGHGPGVIDFFYLPIDFKNKCNRGYAFINFVDYRDILPFHDRYFGKHWRTFNSDKICEITYARIQGKSAMLKRFENSALMEKDEEYKPLVFVSQGSDKGNRLPFPDPSNSFKA